MKSEIDVQIEAVLFYKTEPVAKRELGEFLGVSVQEIDGALIGQASLNAEEFIKILQIADELS